MAVTLIHEEILPMCQGRVQGPQQNFQGSRNSESGGEGDSESQ